MKLSEGEISALIEEDEEILLEEQVGELYLLHSNSSVNMNYAFEQIFSDKLWEPVDNPLLEKMNEERKVWENEFKDYQTTQNEKKLPTVINENNYLLGTLWSTWKDFQFLENTKKVNYFMSDKKLKI